MSVPMQLSLVLALMVCSAFFSIAEISLAGARKLRLQGLLDAQLAQHGLTLADVRTWRPPAPARRPRGRRTSTRTTSGTNARPDSEDSRE